MEDFSFLGDRLVWLALVDSTNTYAKALAVQGAAHGTIVMADHQTGGRGRQGRSFSSPPGLGIYLSLILRPEGSPDRWMHLTCLAAEAARRAIIHETGIPVSIKWVNDLVVHKRKLAGILTELVSTPQGWAVIVGVGINCGHREADFPEEIRHMATSLALEGCQKDRAALVQALVRELDRAMDHLLSPRPWMQSYRAHCITLGKDALLLRGDVPTQAHVDGMDDLGALLITWADGSKETVFSGEVSVRGMYGYV